MTQKEYEQKRHDNWIRFKTENMFTIDEYAFYAAFDRAYALGKQEKESKSMQLSDVKQKIDAWMENHTEEEIYKLLKKHGAVKDADTVIQGWVARDSNESLYLYCLKPERVRYLGSSDGVWMSRTIEKLDPALFPDLTWESDPEEVKLIIKRKNDSR